VSSAILWLGTLRGGPRTGQSRGQRAAGRGPLQPRQRRGDPQISGWLHRQYCLSRKRRQVSPQRAVRVFCERKVGRINDFCTLELARDGKTRRTRARRNKGHEQEIELTLEAIRQGGSSPIPFEELMEVSEATIAIEEAIASGEAVSLRTQQIPAEQKTAENL
jgi:hypothetical protein